MLVQLALGDWRDVRLAATAHDHDAVGSLPRRWQIAFPDLTLQDMTLRRKRDIVLASSVSLCEECFLQLADKWCLQFTADYFDRIHRPRPISENARMISSQSASTLSRSSTANAPLANSRFLHFQGVVMLDLRFAGPEMNQMLVPLCLSQTHIKERKAKVQSRKHRIKLSWIVVVFCGVTLHRRSTMALLK